MKQLKLAILFLLITNAIFAFDKGVVIYNNSRTESSRIKLGISRLETALKKNGYKITYTTQQNSLLDIISIHLDPQLKKEGFSISHQNKIHNISGADETGILYGCLELIEQLSKNRSLPVQGGFADAPEMVLRGQCIGLQKSTYLPGRNVYEYPYTPETFPWLYDKKLWLQVLDSMLENRMNSLYLWNGHPSASLVKLKDYPYAVEVDDATFKKNEEIYRFITTEADKRGIWVIQMFYNILVSKPFAEYHKIKTQDRERHIVPLIADYTRKSIAAFVEKYPNVGLMVCLGEAMEGVGNDDIEWFTKTIIPGVQDGLKALGKKDEPPVVLRAHDTDAPSVMRAALPLYKNLYTEAKFNGEALTYPRPRGSWAELHQTLSKLGSIQIENVHILANLEPFRYGSPDFIQQCVIGMHEVMGGNGLHLYPQASYWDWPYSADKVKGKRLLQIERDWIWYKAWARYAWKAKRNRPDEIKYWSNLLANKYGCSEVDGRRILDTYELTGEIAPKLLRRFGITDGNRQTLTLGMLMTQLINPYRYGLFTLLYDSEAPEGEMLVDWVDKDVKKQPHIGETPNQVMSEVSYNAIKATSVIDSVGKITKNVDEYLRWRVDVYLYFVMARFFEPKIEAARSVLKYKYSQNIELLEHAYRHLNISVINYREFALMTAKSYLYANSMQTQQRKIPMRGADGAYKHWTDMLPVYENELKIFRKKIDSLKNNTGAAKKEAIPFKDASIEAPGSKIKLEKGANLFTDTSFVIKEYAPELEELNGLQFSFKQQMKHGTELNFSSDKPVKVLVGYFKTQRAAFTTDTVFAKALELETNASADDYGQAEAKIFNAISIDGLPPVNIHVYNFKVGKNTLKLPKGVCLVLGFVDGKQTIPVYDAMLMSDSKNKNIDWLFE